MLIGDPIISFNPSTMTGIVFKQTSYKRAGIYTYNLVAKVAMGVAQDQMTITVKIICNVGSISPSVLDQVSPGSGIMPKKYYIING